MHLLKIVDEVKQNFKIELRIRLINASKYLENERISVQLDLFQKLIAVIKLETSVFVFVVGADVIREFDLG